MNSLFKYLVGFRVALGRQEGLDIVDTTRKHDVGLSFEGIFARILHLNVDIDVRSGSVDVFLRRPLIDQQTT